MRKKEEKKEQSKDLHDDILGGLPIPTGLNLSGATKKPSIARVIAAYVFLVNVAMLYCNMNYSRYGD